MRKTFALSLDPSLMGDFKKKCQETGIPMSKKMNELILSDLNGEAYVSNEITEKVSDLQRGLDNLLLIVSPGEAYLGQKSAEPLLNDNGDFGEGF